MKREEALTQLSILHEREVQIEGQDLCVVCYEYTRDLINRIYDDFEKDLVEVYKKGFIKGEMHQMGIAQPPKED